MGRFGLSLPPPRWQTRRAVAVTKLDYEQAIRDQHGCESHFQGAVLVREEAAGQPVWEGPVMIFALRGHPHASTCFTWGTPVPETDQIEYTAILLKSPVHTAADAVRAYLNSCAKRAR